MDLSYAHGASSTPLLGQTIGDNLDRVTRDFADNEALVSVFENQRLSYAQFLEMVNRCARALLALGIRKGERVGIWSTNCVAWTCTQYATAKIGAILVNINPAYRLHELQYALQQSEISVLICGQGFKDSDYLRMLAELLPEINAADRNCDLHAQRLPTLRRIVTLPDHAHEKLLSWNELMTSSARVAQRELDRRQADLDFDDVVNVQYTSGTTGFPKGAMLTHHGILNNAFWVAERMRLTHRDRLCIPVPFYHCFGMVLGNLACTTHGATMVIPAPHFSPLHTLEAVAHEKCTALHGVPTMFVAQLDHPRFHEFDLTSLRTGIMAGAPCPIEVMNRVITEMHCPEITIACGMTETSPVCNQTQANDPIELRVATVGTVLPHQQQKIIEPATGRILPRGQQGELCYRGYHVMRGYYNDPAATQRTIDPAGWLHSGDLAVMDANGYVRVTGRLKDMICRGGEKIFPREVEEFLFTHPRIAEAYVIGIPDPYYGERVVAWIKCKPGATLTDAEVRKFCHDRIMDYKIPQHVRFVNEFPTTVTGKVQKFVMREISAREHGVAEPAATREPR